MGFIKSSEDYDAFMIVVLLAVWTMPPLFWCAHAACQIETADGKYKIAALRVLFTMVTHVVWAVLTVLPWSVVAYRIIAYKL